MEHVVKEPYETTFRAAGALMTDTLRGVVGKGKAVANYGEYCRGNKEEIVRFLNDYIGRRTQGVRAIRSLPVPPRHDSADLYLEVYTEGVPSDTVYYVVRCPVGVVNTIEVTPVEA